MHAYLAHAIMAVSVLLWPKATDADVEEITMEAHAPVGIMLSR